MSEEIEPNIPLSLSIGWELYDPAEDKNLKELFKRADEDMYRHKKEFHENDEL